MNKAVPWNINGVGFDARDAARDAARRQGKSLGEWLHGVIADHAEAIGVEEHEVVGRDRVEAVTSRLERMGARSQPTERRMPHAKASAGHRAAPRRAFADEIDEVEPRRTRRDRPMVEETEFLLEEAIESMERRASRTERRTDEALASFARMLETNETRREREREAVTTMAQKLSDLEGKLTERFSSAAENPVKGALARLEARLDTIGRRSAAEAAARQNAPDVSDKDESLRRLEEKLNSVLDAVVTRPSVEPQTSPIAIAASQAQPQRRLGDAIAEIAERQRLLDEPGAVAPVRDRRPRLDAEPLRRSEPRQVSQRDDRIERDASSFAAMQSEIAGLATKIEDMRREMAAKHEVRREPAADVDALRGEIAAMSRALRDLAPPRGAISALEGSMQALSQRVETSRDLGIRENVLRPIETAVGDLRHALADIDPRKTIGSLQLEVRSIADKVDGLAGVGIDGGAVERLQSQMQDIRDLISATAERPLAVEQIEGQIATLAARMDRQSYHPDMSHELGAATDALRAMVVNPPGADALGKIERRLEALATRVDEAFTEAHRPVAPQAAPDVSSLESLVRDLSGKLEATQAPGADNHAIEALQRQIEMLAARFERSESGLAVLPKLQAEMRDLFTHLEATRASAESSAAKAAREVLRIAMADGKGRTDPAAAHEIAVLKAMQDDADLRTQSTLGAVHDTLAKVVDRLSTLDRDIASANAQPMPRPAAQPKARPVAQPLPRPAAGPAPRPGADPARPKSTDLGSLALGAADSSFRQPTGAAKKAEPVGGRFKPADLDDEAGRADFIAAARRAAQAAQSDPSVVALKRPASKADAEMRAGLLAKSRDYVATHKRPVLMSIAALFVVLGTMAIIQRIGLQADSLSAQRETPTRIASLQTPPRDPTVANMPASLPRVADGDLSPSALPKSTAVLDNPIPGSDPIQTGSIPSLPSFAAGAAAQPTEQAPPPGLVSMAQAGNGAAEYELGARYAEGRMVPRDLKLAVKWYEKAAEQGVAPAQYRLASLYEKGLGITQDKAKAKALYLKAADAGNPRAMHNLAVLLADGDGHPDYTGAALWFRRAAQFGVHDSQYNLAILLARGLGAPQSLVQSYQWFAIAAAQNDTDAGKKRDEVATKLSANDLAVAKALAAAFQPKTPEPSTVDVQPPPGGWDGVAPATHLNSARSKISSL